MNLSESKNQKVFIAGASGMVGSSIKRAFLKNKKNNPTILSPTRKECDLSNYNSVDNWLKKNKPNIVIIAAAKVGGIFANKTHPTEFILENLKIQTNLIELSYKYKVDKLLFLGSSCIYPKFAKQPIKEEYLLDGSLEETNQWYATAKIAGLKLCEAFNRQYDFDAISLMPTNMYGPNDNYKYNESHVMAAFLKRFKHAAFYNLDSVDCWGTGVPLREFLHVDDLASAVVFCLEYWDPESESAPKDKNGEKINYLNVGFGKDISIKDLAELIADLAGYKGKINWDKTKPDGTPKKLLNIDKIKELGWYPKIDLKEGILRTLEEISL